MVVENSATLTYIQLLKEDLAIFRLVPNDGIIPEYKAGQFITIGMNVPSEGKVIRRAYSISSHPENKKFVELVIRWVRKPAERSEERRVGKECRSRWSPYH